LFVANDAPGDYINQMNTFDQLIDLMEQLNREQLIIELLAIEPLVTEPLVTEQ